MTIDEVNFAMNQRESVFIARGSIEILKPFKIKSVAKTIRDEIDVARGKEPYYYEAILSDPNGRGVIRTFPEQLDPADPERFAAMWDRYRKMREEQNAET